jgi:hypothetical protein
LEAGKAGLHIVTCRASACEPDIVAVGQCTGIGCGGVVASGQTLST